LWKATARVEVGGSRTVLPSVCWALGFWNFWERISEKMEKHTVLVSVKTIDGETFTAKVHGESKEQLYEAALQQVSDSLRGLIYGHRWEYVSIAVASKEDGQSTGLENP
jgi:hypothetical protein